MTDFERWAAYSAVEREQLSWQEWSKRLQKYYDHLEFVLSPDLFIVGGGVSKHADEFLPLLSLNTPMVPAVHRNNAGIMEQQHSPWRTTTAPRCRRPSAASSPRPTEQGPRVSCRDNACDDTG